MVFVYMQNFSYIAAMFIRQVKKKNSKNGKTFFQYQLVQASRIEGKVKQQSILYLGSEPLLADAENRKMLITVLQAKIFGQNIMFTKDFPGFIHELASKYHEKFKIKYKNTPIEGTLSVPPVGKKIQMENIDISSIGIEDSRTFGGEHLCSQIAEKLGLQPCFVSLGFSKKESALAHISIISRALFKASEYKTSMFLDKNSELQRIHGQEDKRITHYKLYKIADKLYDNKDFIDDFMYSRFIDLFDIKDTLVIYDLSNTYFEGRKASSKLARFGKNKEKRNDCKQVVFTGVINEQGFIRYSRIYDGNTSDIPTLKQMIEDLKKHSGNYSEKVVVIDAGIASEDNLAYLQGEKLKYVCVSRKRIKDYQVHQGTPTVKMKDKRDNLVELQIFKPKGFHDTWMYVKSKQKRIKEQSMNDKLSARFEEELQGLSDGLEKKGVTKKLKKGWERIGRLKEKYRLVSSKYTIDVVAGNENAKAVRWQRKKEITRERAENNGVYFIRTNIERTDERKLWNVYNTIREVESTFRCLKTDLQIRPIFHQKDDRVESHIYLAILAYQLVNTIRHMLKEKGIKLDWRNIVRIMSTQTIQSIILNGETKKICVRKPSKPIHEAMEIYRATKTNSMTQDKKKYVVYH